ncbi:MAG: DUF222 domain-containing protein, partial [Actinomycetota bacterium]
EERSAWMVDAGDGMVDVGLHVAAVVGVAIWDRATQSAKAKPKDDPRTFDQFRADAMSELLLCGVSPDDLHGASPIRATVTVTIPATELLRDPALAEQADEAGWRFPALLDGKVLVDAATARDLAAETAVWERLFLHPVTGLPV